MSLPPGPRLPKLLQTARVAAHPLRFYQQSQRRYGDLFTLRYHPFGTMVYVCDPQAIKQIFTGDPSVFHAGEANQFMEPLLGRRSVLLLDRDEHMRMRKLMLPAFHGKSVTRYGDVIADIARRDLQSWPVGQPFALRPRMQSITLEVILRAVFGIDDPERMERLRPCLAAMLEINPLFGIAPFLRIDLGPRFGWGRFMRARAAADAMIYDEIARRRADPDIANRGDVLSLLLQSRDEHGVGLTDAELRDELMTLLLAGHETTATALAWAFERLLRHPEALARLRAELAEGEETYLEAVVKETLRARPVVMDVGRTLMEPVTVGDYELPAGVMVVPMITLVQSSDAVHDDAQAFRPERFLDGQPAPYTWIPFGGGVRRCLGASFATFEMKMVLCTILPAAELRASRPEPERQRLRNVTFVPEHGGEVVLDRRAEPAAMTIDTARAGVAA
jgi:cytochrome P450